MMNSLSPSRRLTASLLTGVAALFLVAAAPAEPISNNGESQGYYEDARKQLDKGDGRAAMIQLKNALRTDPDNAAARHLIGLLYLRGGDGELAEKELKTAIQHGYPAEQALAELAESYMIQGKYEALLKDFPSGNRGTALETEILLLHGYAEAALHRPDDAIKSFGDAEAMSPKDARPLAGIARVELDRGKRDEAEAALNHALEVNPKSAEALGLMGEVHRGRREVDQAIDYYGRALAIDPRNRTALIGRVAIHLDRGETAQADPDIKTLIALSPRNPITNYLAALAQAQHKDVAGALASLQKQRTALENYPPAIYLQAVLQYQQNQLEQAVAGFTRYLELVPQDPRARKLLAASYLKKNAPGDAIQALSPALDSAPNDVQVLSLLGSAYMAERRYDKATEMLSRAAAANPKDAVMQTQLAAGQLQAGEAAEAVKALEQALNLDPSETEANLLLVMTHLRDRNFDAARQAAQKFQTALPNSPVPLAMLGTVANAQGDRPGARGFFEQALKRQPDYVAARMSLAQLDIQDGDYAAAAERYQETLKRDPNNIGAMLAMSELQYRQDKIDDSIAWLERARAADLTATEPRFRLVDAYLSRNDPAKAVVVAGELNTIAPQSARTATALATAQLASGDKDTAVATYRRAVALQPQAPQPLQFLARALNETGDVAGARTALQQALTLAPDYEPVRADLIALELKANQPDAALKLAQEWHEAKPDNPASGMLLADVQMREQLYPDAIKSYEAVLKQVPNATTAALLVEARQRAGVENPAAPLEDYVASHPDDGRGHQILGQRYLALKDLPNARKEYEKLVALVPTDAATLNNLAWIYQSEGDKRATEVAARAYDLAAGSPQVADTYGWILAQNGATDKALPILRDAAGKLPNNAEVQYHLAAVMAKSGDQAGARRMLESVLATNQQFDGADDARALLSTIATR